MHRVVAQGIVGGAEPDPQVIGRAVVRDERALEVVGGRGKRRRDLRLSVVRV